MDNVYVTYLYQLYNNLIYLKLILLRMLTNNVIWNFKFYIFTEIYFKSRLSVIDFFT